MNASFCTQCGAALVAGQKFCKDCGKAIVVRKRAAPIATSGRAPPIATREGKPLVPSRDARARRALDPSGPAALATPPNRSPAPPVPVSGDPLAAPSLESASPGQAEFRPAGFWRRLIAIAADTLVLWGILYVLGLATTWLMNRAIESAVVDPEGNALREIMTRYQIANVLATIVVAWIYFAGLEASALRATPGKRLMGVRLMDANGRRLPLWRSTLRYFAKPLSAAPFMLGFLMAGMNRRRRALHDLISGSYAVVGRVPVHGPR